MSAGSGSAAGPGVVERASKEISRRIHSLGFTKRSKDDKEKAAASITDKLNGNEVQDEQNGSGVKVSSCSSPSSVSKMGTIIKGSVMDKVTHVFNSSGNSFTMGNANNKEQQQQNSQQAKLKEGQTSSAINIPKGAVANGRAKFEAAAATQQPAPAASEKPMRFFSSSKSRGNSPLLPVKTPKVPNAATSAGNTTANNSIITNTAAISSTTIASTSTTTVTITSTSQTKKKASVTNSSSSVSGVSSTNSSVNNGVTLEPQRNSHFDMSPATNAKLFPKMKRFIQWEEMWKDSKFLHRFFWYFCPQERIVLAQVCQAWRDVIYAPVYWHDQRPVIPCRILRHWTDNDPEKKDMKRKFFQSLMKREFETAVLLNANDADIFDFVQNFPEAAKILHGIILRCCNISDRGLEALLEFLQSLFQLEIAGCNELTEQGLWSSLHPRLVSITINDCINVADECVCAVTQLLPALYEFNMQAYHVTDAALSYFSPKQTGTLNILRLQSCWEITNHGIVNIVHTLPNLTVLSLSGCSKITDDGIELIAENLRKLRSLDVSWCPRVTDAALEYIACDLNHLEELTLDRCVHVTDIGIGYISTMLALHTLYLRWCTQIRDFGLQHICGMRSMQVLSLAGCPLLTSSGMSNLVQLRHLVELELTNCPGATPELIDYLRQNLPDALVLD